MMWCVVVEIVRASYGVSVACVVDPQNNPSLRRAARRLRLPLGSSVGVSRSHTRCASAHPHATGAGAASWGGVSDPISQSISERAAEMMLAYEWIAMVPSNWLVKRRCPAFADQHQVEFDARGQAGGKVIPVLFGLGDVVAADDENPLKDPDNPTAQAAGGFSDMSASPLAK